MAIRYLDEPTTAQPQAAQPAGRIRYLDDTPADFEQFAQPDPIRATPRLPMEEGTPTTSSPSLQPLEAQESPRPALTERAKLGARVGFAESGLGLLARTPAGQTLKDLPAGLGLGTDVAGGLFRLMKVPTNAQETVALRQEFENMPNAKNAAELAATGIGFIGGGTLSPEAIVPVGRGATLLRRVAGTAGVTGGLNALLDIGRQELDIAQGIKGEFSIGELALNAGAGAVAGGLIHLSLEGLGRLSQRIREALASGKLTPDQAAELAKLEQAAQLAAQRKAQAVEADVTPTKFDIDPKATAALLNEDPRATAALREAVAQPEPRLADIVPEETALAGLRDAAPEQVRTPVDDALAAPRTSTQVAPEATPRAPEPSTPGTRSFGNTADDPLPTRAASTPEEDLAAYNALSEEFNAKVAAAKTLKDKDEAFAAMERAIAEGGQMRESLKNRHFGGETPSEAILTGMREGKTPAQVQRPDEVPAPTESAAAPRAAETAAPAPRDRLRAKVADYTDDEIETLAEDLADAADSFRFVRESVGSGLQYELRDLAQNFVDFARANRPNDTIWDAFKAFKGTTDASANLERKLQTLLSDAGFSPRSKKAATRPTTTQPRSVTPEPVATAAETAPTPKPAETRGKGIQYHGARQPITSLSEGYYNPANIYGGESTFYTTDALDVASGYPRKSPNGIVYKVTEKGPVNFYNMEEAKTTAQWNAFFKDEPQEGLVAIAIDNATEKRGRANLREIMDEIRAESANENVSMDEVQGIFATITARLEQQGFGGMTHIGGLKTKTPPHNVKIYFRPKEQIALEPASPAASPTPTPKSAPSKPYSFKEWSDAIEAGASPADLPNPKLIGKDVGLYQKKLKDLGSAGRINITPGTTTLGGALVGGAGGAGYGITQGDTVEERLENAFAFGLAGAAAGAGAGRAGGKFAMTKPGHNVGKRLGVIEDFPVLNQDISNARIQLQRIGGILMRGSRLRKPFFDAMRRTEADIASMTDEAKIILSDARGKINAATKKGPEREALEAKLNEVFGDITKIGELPEYLRPMANRIHQIRLKGAARIAALDGITDATRDTVLENGGDYLARKYAIFNLRDGLEARAYRESLPKEDINAALDAIQESWKPKPKTKEQQKLAADMLEQVANDQTNAVAVIKSLRQWMTDDDAARMAAWIAGGKQGGSDVGRRMRSLYNELINPTEVSRDEARSLLDEFLDRDTLAGFTLGRKQIGGKDVTSLYRKKEIDQRLRKVLGEIKDPLANAYQSIENQANLIGRDKQQREFIRIGEAMGIMTRDPDVALEKGMRPFVESGTKLNNPYDNYDGVFIYPWLRDEFKGSVIQADEIPKAGDVALKSLKSATALFKWLKLIPAPDSRSVNLIGAYWNNAVNGRGINPVNGRTLDGVKSVFLANGLISPNGSPNTARLLALREKLIRHRVLDESVLGRDFIENTRRSFAGQLFDKLDETAQREIDSPLARKAYMAGKFVASGREFAAGDDIFRVAGFLAEANRYKRAFPNLPEAEIEELAGRVLNQTGMTYSEVPYALRELSQLGVVEPFVSFPYSVFRSTANTARLGAAEMADGLATGNTELAKIGARRLTALGIGATLASGYGLSRALNEKHDVTPEQEEAAKLFGPDYIKDSPLAFDSKIENGKATFVQMNYLLPTSLVTEAIEEGLKKAAEDGPMAGVGAGVRSTASQFTGMLDESRQQVPPVPRTIGLALGLLNEDSFGRPIYNPEDPDKWKKIAGTIGYDWSPGFWSKAVRLYKANNPAARDPQSPRVYSNSEEFMRFLGRRATTVDAKQVFPSKAYQLNQDYQNATRLYQEAVRKTGTEGPEAVEAYATVQGVITDKFNEMVEMRDAARLLGMNDDTITAGFLRGGMSKRLTGQVMQSINIPPPKEALDARIEKRAEQRKAYREVGGEVGGDAQALVARVRAQNLPPDQFLKALEAEWRASRIGMDANGRMTREFADALKAEIERTK